MKYLDFKKNDWIGAGVSIGAHVLVLFLLSLIAMAPAEPISLGYVEVTFGPMSEARPAPEEQETQEPAAPEPRPPTPEEEPQPAPPEQQPPQTQPVELPETATNDPEQIDPQEEGAPSEGETAENAPEEQTAEPVIPASEESAAPQEQGEQQEAISDTGEGQDDETSAPFRIEGLNRVTLSSPLPRYTAQVNATIKVRITVSPEGRITQRIPLIKSNPDLEDAVMAALDRWQFNPLPENAPQISQTGTVTFHFRLE